jgi:hypothetical protein
MKAYIDQDEYDKFMYVVDEDKYRGPNAADDSYLFYTDSPGRYLEVDITEGEWADYVQTYRKYNEWQEKLNKLWTHHKILKTPGGYGPGPANL